MRKYYQLYVVSETVVHAVEQSLHCILVQTVHIDVVEVPVTYTDRRSLRVHSAAFIHISPESTAMYSEIVSQ